jgi:hypothetical protein
VSEADLDTHPPGTGRRLGELVALATTPRTGTGCRVADRSFHAEMIGSFFAFFAGRSSAGGITWGLRTWKEFVEAGQLYSLAVAEIPGRAAREAAWRAGLTRGARFLASAARPRLNADQIRHLLSEICPPFTSRRVSGW